MLWMTRRGLGVQGKAVQQTEKKRLCGDQDANSTLLKNNRHSHRATRLCLTTSKTKNTDSLEDMINPPNYTESAQLP